MPKLTIEMIPKATWGENLRSLRTDRWDALRRATYINARYKCEICGGKGKEHPVECHEVWKLDKKKKVQRLVGLIALCPMCHMVKHAGRATALGNFESVIHHLRHVNSWTRRRAITYYYSAVGKSVGDSEHEWTVDISYVDFDDIKIIRKGR